MSEHLNSVELLGYYGGDEVNALSAWTSTSRSLTDDKRGRIGALLTMLAENGHYTPFEKSNVHFLVKTDIATHIHLLKHRTWHINAESARYRELEDKFYVPSDWEPAERARLQQHMWKSFDLYHAAVKRLEPSLGRKRAKESARFYLPYANQISADVQADFRNFMHFQKLRNDEHAQDEIHWIAEEMLRLIHEIPGDPFHHSLGAFGHAS